MNNWPMHTMKLANNPHFLHKPSHPVHSIVNLSRIQCQASHLPIVQKPPTFQLFTHSFEASHASPPSRVGFHSFDNSPTPSARTLLNCNGKAVEHLNEGRSGDNKPGTVSKTAHTWGSPGPRLSSDVISFSLGKLIPIHLFVFLEISFLPALLKRVIQRSRIAYISYKLFSYKLTTKEHKTCFVPPAITLTTNSF